MTKVMIVGTGGREHALARQFEKNTQISEIIVVPGNDGMRSDKIKTEAIALDAIDELLAFAKNRAIDLTFVGSEDPLALGIVDRFREENLAIVGPTQAAAQLESSKAFAKEIMTRADVKTADYRYFKSEEAKEAHDFIDDYDKSFVIKADGLMAGKGVWLPESKTEAHDLLTHVLEEEQSDCVIEERLFGVEFSFFSFVNGDHVIPIGSACDYKRAVENDEGLNTGGMGAFSPVPWVDEDLEQIVIEEIVKPVAHEMIENGTPYTGVLYSGLMLTADGPQVIEFNARFGDPETQVVLPRLTTDFYDLVMAHLESKAITVETTTDTHIGVVFASKGYPENYPKGMPIHFDQTLDLQTVYVAGAKNSADHESLVTDGGRILMVTAEGKYLADARENVYRRVDQITIPDSFYRSDIGLHRKGEITND